MSWAHTSEQNCGPLSEVMCSGTPNLTIQPATKASVMAAVVALERGRASSQRNDLSMMVRMWLYPSGEEDRLGQCADVRTAEPESPLAEWWPLAFL